MSVDKINHHRPPKQELLGEGNQGELAIFRDHWGTAHNRQEMVAALVIC